jgi:large subunit ribosomal protein L32
MCPASSDALDPPDSHANTQGGVQEIFMAVQQNKKSPSKRGMHRSHNAVAAPGTGIEPTTGEVHMRHHISPTGFYRGRKVLKTKADA